MLHRPTFITVCGCSCGCVLPAEQNGLISAGTARAGGTSRMLLGHPCQCPGPLDAFLEPVDIGLGAFAVHLCLAPRPVVGAHAPAAHNGPVKALDGLCSICFAGRWVCGVACLQQGTILRAYTRFDLAVSVLLQPCQTSTPRRDIHMHT